MSVPTLPQPVLITDDAALLRQVARLKHEPLLAIDTESNHMYAYRGRICLIQVSTRHTDYIIDPLTINDMQPFGDLLLEARIEKVFHGAEYDLAAIKRDYDFDLNNLFDTLLALRVLGRDTLALGDVLHADFGIELDKSHQLDDWGLRPLAETSLIYAQMDTHFLPALRDRLFAELEQAQRMDEAIEVFEDYSRARIKDDTFDPEGYWQLGRPRSLTRRQMGVLREVYLLREDLARRDDLPTHKIATNRELVALAMHRPHNNSELSQIIESKLIRLYGDDLLAAIQRGQAAKPPKPPQNRQRPDRRLIARYNALHNWRKEQAQARNLEANIVMSKRLLWDLAEQTPQTPEALTNIPGIGAWRMAQYGGSLLELLQQLHPKS